MKLPEGSACHSWKWRKLLYSIQTQHLPAVETVQWVALNKWSGYRNQSELENLMVLQLFLQAQPNFQVPSMMPAYAFAGGPTARLQWWCFQVTNMPCNWQSCNWHALIATPGARFLILPHFWGCCCPCVPPRLPPATLHWRLSCGQENPAVLVETFNYTCTIECNMQRHLSNRHVDTTTLSVILQTLLAFIHSSCYSLQLNHSPWEGGGGGGGGGG